MLLKLYIVAMSAFVMADFTSILLPIQQNQSIISTNNILDIIDDIFPIECYISCHKRNGCCATSFNQTSGTCLLHLSKQWSTNTEGSVISGFPTDIWAVNTSSYGSSTHLPKDCSEIPKGSCSGKYTIYPFGTSGVDVYCDMATDGGNWTVFQKRQDGSVDFYLEWNSYKIGFGDANTEFWIGNDNLHALTSQDNYQLRVDIWDWDEIYKFAVYDTFKVADSSKKYRLTISGYSGDAGDSFTYQNNMMFSTWDRDNDGLSSYNCAKNNNKGGFWYRGCQTVNLNGRFRPFPIYGTDNGPGSVITWNAFRGSRYSMKRCAMMLRKL